MLFFLVFRKHRFQFTKWQMLPVTSNLYQALEEGIMNIDNMISSFDFDKFKSKCLLYDFLKAYLNKKTNLSSTENNEANVLRIQLEDYSDILERLFKYIKCFPSECENCMGLQKCIACVTANNCVDAFIELRIYL